MDPHDLGQGALRDLADAILGEEIGRGSCRTVFTFRPDPGRYVVKIEEDAGSFQNVKEWSFWQDNCYCKPIAKWLAPCWRIGANGIVLIQRRTYPVPPDKLPKLVPWFLTDIKEEHFGYLDRRIVCNDYALTCTTVSARLRKSGF